jgi:hypothetical protein
VKPGPEWQESQVGVKEESQFAGRSLVLPRLESLVIVRLLHVTTASGERAQKEVLGEACANPFSRANRKVSEH